MQGLVYMYFQLRFRVICTTLDRARRINSTYSYDGEWDVLKGTSLKERGEPPALLSQEQRKSWVAYELFGSIRIHCLYISPPPGDKENVRIPPIPNIVIIVRTVVVKMPQLYNVVHALKTDMQSRQMQVQK